MTPTTENPSQSILDFWFREIDRKLWFRNDPEFDALLRHRFLTLHHRATQGELGDWRHTAGGTLAEIIILDQFSRNLYRAMPQAFAWDGMALVLAQEALRHGLDQQLDSERKAFLYMPFMHSESRVIHAKAVELFAQKGLENNYDFEMRHKGIIDRFGRYPHRNRVLGRESTAEELEFLTTPGSSF